MRRGGYTARGVVLNSWDFGESDRILSIFTDSFGKVRAIAKGARRSRKRFVGKLDPTSHIGFGFFSNGRSELVRLEHATLINGYNTLRDDITRFTGACSIIELAEEMTREGQVMPGVYALLADFLGLLEDAAASPGVSHEAVTRFFEIKLLRGIGLMPSLASCVSCGAPRPGCLADGPSVVTYGAPGSGVTSTPGGVEKLHFSSERGGVLCSGCARGAGRVVAASHGAASLLAMAERLSPEKLLRLRPSPDALAECGTLLDDFITHQLGRELKTRMFLEKLRKASF